MSDGGQWRVEFDADVTFANGGGLQVQGFRLDVPGDRIEDGRLAELLVRHLGLLMVGDVSISNKRMLREPHKGGRGVAVAAPGPRRLVELSHVVREGMITYPGLPGPTISDHLSREASKAMYASGTTFQIGLITICSNTGTYVDTPFHRYEDGTDLSGFPLSSLADLDGVVVRVTGAAGRAIDRAALLPYDVRGRAVLIHTDWCRHWGTETYGSSEHPYLTEDAAEWLAEQGAALVGIDSLNIDHTPQGGTRPAHTVLLAAGIPIVEHMRGLEQLPPEGFRFHAAPPRVEGMGTFTVRAYAVVGGEDGAA
ncbi:cyclase family protein [Streptomyces sp. A7024]|uniref:Cyclase family protein n=1 Tax=Streptomyces coryli TaxID=1128680 RepID=A0A6G4TXV3_9ACTN|nr:cyclase family protein [Streptomyces coryli]NGN64839.1 cyclase family protein [Streptomyces coryli]